MVNTERIIKNFNKLVEFDSLSFNERKTADFINEYLKNLGFYVEEDKSGEKYEGNAGNIYGLLKGNIPGKPVLFSAHMDVVSPGKGKKAVYGDNGIITSDKTTVLGADDIAGIVEILEGIQMVKEQGADRRDVEVLFSIGEEAYIKGTDVFDFSKVKSENAYVLDLSGAVGTAAVKAPSIISFRITLKGIASHAGFAPEKGTNAIALMCSAVSEVKQGHTDEETTLNIGTINGGTATNIVSDYAECTGEIRSFNHDKALKCLEELKKIFDKTIENTKAEYEIIPDIHMKAYSIDENDDVVIRFKKVCANLGLKGELVSTFGGSDNNNLAANGLHGIVLSCGMYNVHSKSEYTTIEDLEKGAGLVAGLLCLPE